ncbi:MAG: hypothetical protein ACYTF9_15590, partial [Planctomycetota bacterium]
MRTRNRMLVCSVLTLACVSWATASVVVTQVEERAFFSLWLLSEHIQQDVAHADVQKAHDVSAVPVFNAETLAGVDVVYVSPALDELNLTIDEIDALEQFVLDGGRLIVPGDYTMWSAQFFDLAARFGVSFGDELINLQLTASVTDTNNTVMNGPGGHVDSFTGSAICSSLGSTNPDFQVIAEWSTGPNAIGYLRHGFGDVVFLSDFNTFDTDMYDEAHNQILWANLFFADPETCPADATGDNVVDVEDLVTVILDFGCSDDCPGDVNGDGPTDVEDLIEV